MDFSVIIPAYNCEKTIAHTVDSIEAVQLDNMEILLIDDGSTDLTHEVCKNIAIKYKNVRCFHQENAGVSAARNFGIQQAKGAFILFCDSDDTVDPVLMRKCMLKAIEQNADMLAFGIIFQYSYHGKIIREEHLKCETETLLHTADFANNLANLFDLNYLSSACNKVFKRSICQKVLFNSTKKIFEDLLYVLEYLNNCNSVYLMPDLAYVYEIEEVTKKSQRSKYIDDFEQYMVDFQLAVLALEDTLQTRLPELRKRITNVYEWILSRKLESSSYNELKHLDSQKMRATFFGEPYEVKLRTNRLFFYRKILLLNLICFFRITKKFFWVKSRSLFIE